MPLKNCYRQQQPSLEIDCRLLQPIDFFSRASQLEYRLISSLLLDRAVEASFVTAHIVSLDFGAFFLKAKCISTRICLAFDWVNETIAPVLASYFELRIYLATERCLAITFHALETFAVHA